MNGITFGICSTRESSGLLNQVIDSIEDQRIDNYEVIIVGSVDVHRTNTIVFPFDETVRSGWITKKKNIIGAMAKYDTIVMMHDYIKILKGWHYGLKKFGHDWDVCTNIVIRVDGRRGFDWFKGAHGHLEYLDYRTEKTDGMYPAGNFFLVKKKFLEDNPFNEQLGAGQGEDVEWGNRILPFCSFKMNTNSCVQYIKDHWYKNSPPANYDLYSQIGQDSWIIGLFPGNTSGYFVEVGAHDGIEFSNTLALERLGWDGICIEPSTVSFDKLKQSRRCVCVNKAVCNSKRTIWLAEKGVYSSISNICEASRTEQAGDVLTSILDEHGAPHIIDYLSIDTEGAEVEVLEGIDFKRYNFRAMTVEHNYNHDHRMRIRNILGMNGYSLAREAQWDDWFLPTSSPVSS